MKIKSLFMLTLIINVLTACINTGPKRVRDEFDPNNCNEQAGYEFGYSDGKWGKEMDTQFARRCREDLRDQTYAGYRKGFDQGHKELLEIRKQRLEEERIESQRKTREERDRRMGQTPEPPRENRPLIDIRIGSGANNSPPAPAPAQPNPKAFYCSTNAFNNTFDGFGPTEIETRRSVEKACEARYSEMFCREIKCERNQ